MGKKLSNQLNKDSFFERIFFCPGCCQFHGFRTIEWPEPLDLSKEEKESFKNKWIWDGNEESPTINPSIIIKDGSETKCHFFIKRGKILFLDDCKHRYKGKIIDLPAF